MSDFVPSLSPAAHISMHRYIHVIGSKVFISDRVEIDTGSDPANDLANDPANDPANDTAKQHFVGMHGSEAVWAIDVPEGEDPSFGAAVDLYSYYGRASEVEWAIAGRAVQLAEWGRTHKFCGRCGTATELAGNDRSMKCPACGLPAYPRLAPAMITLVTRGEPGPDQQALLARGVAFRAPMYSCLAGFVEPGESLEQSVIREVREEVGIEVMNPRYWGSQPWPFPHSLMIGFTAEWESGEIVCDPTEILDAHWYSRDELPSIPPRISIARKLIDAWVAEG